MEHDAERELDSDTGELTPGAVLRGRYVLEELIGRGGHSLVFRAKDLHRTSVDDPAGGRVALKALRPPLRSSSRAIERLSREFRQMQRLSHAGIARVFDLDCDGDIWFMTMELVSGSTAAEWLVTSPAVGNAMRVIGQCAEALQYAHSMGVIHGDLKPSNILVTLDLQVRLIDFGSVPPQSEHVRYIAATPPYASPQVLAGMRADVRDDVFSLACVGYEILSEGQRPFGDQSSLEAHRARLCPAAIPGMPVEVFSTLVRSLSGEPEHRAASAAALYRDLLGDAPDPRLGRNRGGTRRTLRQVSLASIGVAAACSLILLLPTSRTIVAGDEDTAQNTPAPRATNVDQSIDSAAPALTPGVGGDVAGVSAVQPGPVAESVLSDSGASAPRASGLVTFENGALVASAAQSLIAIPVKRLKSTRGAAAVEWQVEGGGFNVDYKSMPSQVVRFREGEAVRSIFIPLLHGTAGSGIPVPHSFSVTLRQVDGGVRLGSVTRVNVTVVPQPHGSDLSNAVAASFSSR